MKILTQTSENIVIEGILNFDRHHTFRRYTDEIVEKIPRLAEFDKRCTGARLRFRTDSAKVRIEMQVGDQFVDRGMSYYQANTAYAFSGPYSSSVYKGLLSAEKPYEDDTIHIEFDNDGMNEITVFFPRNSSVSGVKILLDDTAAVELPAPHKTELPFVFYGSSITEQGLTSAPFAYPSLLSRFFDADFYNFGASGNARGETELAEYLGRIPKSIFFYDYDHNAPDAEHLRNTHEAFFRRFREFDPLTPVIMTSRPANDTPEYDERRAIIRKTWENAVADGDRNVWFLDGPLLFGSVDPALCTTDVTHPNDLGHYLMAQTVKDFVVSAHIMTL